MKVQNIGVVGAGLMGSGISYVSAAAGYDVVLMDSDDNAVKRGLDRIHSYVETGVNRGKLTGQDGEMLLKRIHATSDIEDAVSQADLVIEAVFENMDVKKDVFRKMDEAASTRTILASNTSSLSISELGKTTERPKKVIGMHYFSPVPAMKLLEVVIGRSTNNDTIQTAIEVGGKQGKTTVKAKDSPGFIVNRLRMQALRAAILIYEQGLASAEEIDTAMKEQFHAPMGSLELTDFVGLDISFGTMSTLHRELGPCFEVPDTLRNFVQEGRIGRKAGKGFYSYDGQQHALEEPTGADPSWIVTRIIMPYLRESMIEYETGIASKEDIDKAMKLGSNYEEGPFETIERLGHGAVRKELEKLRQEFGDCYNLPKMLE
jgi:3-hydroxybutyryl-CoA dehydrogenase